VNYLDLEDLRAAAAAALDAPLEVRDWGLVESALARPQATAFGEDAYISVWEKAAALLLSLVGNHALVDGNKRVGLTCAVLFLYKNGQRLSFEEDEAYDFVIAVAEGRVWDVVAVAAVLQAWAVTSRQ
jgi:death-on-curing protein